MKYELVPKDVLDAVCVAIQESIIQVTNKDVPAVKLELERAYNTLMRNRTGCNVRPEEK